ncbi:ubiquinone biosynthesis protein Coq7 [Lactifluus volemus]|nr:ubiquinone biosynthesis protein Coq7 [Lactifluus volemus]
MNKLQIQHQIRPTILWEVVKVAGFGLGAVTALMGKEAAMACTEAVETVIGEHYDDQLKDLQDSTHPSIVLLRDVIREFRDDELHRAQLSEGTRASPSQLGSRNGVQCCY